MKSVVWIGRRQVRGLIVLLALLPLIPSSFLIHIMWLNSEKDQLQVVDDMNRVFRDQLHLAMERFSTATQSRPRGEDSLVRFMTHVFGDDLSMIIESPDGRTIYQTAGPVTQKGLNYRIVDGEFAGYEISLDSSAQLPIHIVEERRKTFRQTAVAMLVTILIAAAVWYIINRGLRIDEIRKDLISTISHEIKTPVSAIQVLTESIESGELNPAREAEYIKLIASENKRIEQLANRFLTYGRLEKGQLPINLEPIVFQNAADEVRNHLSPAFSAADGDISIEDGEEIEILADPNGLTILLTNLLENALKYGGESPRALISATANGKHALIAVSDNGNGIPPSESKAIFRSFYRSDGRLDDGQTGVGLGLAICRRIARLMNGSLEVGQSNRPGYAGAEFQLKLPLAR